MTIGSALSHENAVIHAAFFSAARVDRSVRMAGYERRRRYRTAVS